MTGITSRFMGLATAGAVAALVLSGCDGMARTQEEREQHFEDARQEKNDATMDAIRAQGIEIEQIELPKEFETLSKGSYAITLDTEQGPRDCIANVAYTTHGARNVILACD